jgi:uncharacterized protein YgbK (DUF1537 family)
MILGVIADDFTGATDVASMLVRAGMHTVQVIGVPRGALPQADAVVIALKTRTCPPAEAIEQSLQALSALQGAGARQIYFKYCSTFDSTAQGNIGPVADALMKALGARITIACPAFPENGRTIYRGHLFVGDLLLSDSSMRTHPLTPMLDANLLRVLQPQTEQQVGLLPEPVVSQGPDAIGQALQALQRQGVGIAVADATHNQHLLNLAEACADLPVVTAGSGLALGLGPAYARRGWFTPKAEAAQLQPVLGRAAVVSGSCSHATQAQIAHWKAAGHASLLVDPLAVHQGRQSAQQLQAQALALLERGPVLVHAAADADSVRAAQSQLGVQQAGDLTERTLAALAQTLVQAGVRKLVVAGGETSGAVTQELGIERLRIGASICPGVPWTEGLWQGEPLWLALKSGNFGGPDFFSAALACADVQA